eukprot:2613883-Alexandrium_andersonii.AAC.1
MSVRVRFLRMPHSECVIAPWHRAVTSITTEGARGGSRSGRAARTAAPRTHHLCSQPGRCRAQLRICNAPW